MAQFESDAEDEIRLLPIVHVVSDSSGDTADEVVEAAALQFDDGALEISRLPKVRSIAQVTEYFDAFDPRRPTAVFHTIANPSLRRAIRTELDQRSIPSIDLLGPAVNIMSGLTGLEPSGTVGLTREGDVQYLSRIDAMSFVSSHDNENFDELPKADAVLFGVTRTSKTPLSLYLSLKGYKVACVTFALDRELPAELKRFDARRIFGMIPAAPTHATDDEPLSDAAVFTQVGSYSDPEAVNVEQKRAREVMDELGCQTVEMQGKSVEVLAQEIIGKLNDLKHEQMAD